MTTAVYSHVACLEHDPGQYHPESPARLSSVLDALNVELTESAPPKEGKSGLFVTNAWRIHHGTHAPEIYLVNDVVAY